MLNEKPSGSFFVRVAALCSHNVTSAIPYLSGNTRWVKWMKYLVARNVLIQVVVLLWSCSLIPLPVLQQWEDAEGVVLSDGHPGILGLLVGLSPITTLTLQNLVQAQEPGWADSPIYISERGWLQRNCANSTLRFPDEQRWKFSDYWQDISAVVSEAPEHYLKRTQ